jgi:predicted phosphoribosyltransferase
MYDLIFDDRQHAGRLLAQTIDGMKLIDPVVLAIPRGGVVVGYEIAKRIKCPLDVIIPRKVGAPFEPELAVGAVTEDGTLYVNERICNIYGISKSYLQNESQIQIREIKRRAELYRKGAKPISIAGKTVILVDDGIATGATMRAAIMSVKKYSPRSIIVAVPVGAKETVDDLKKEADVVALHAPEDMSAVGEFYRNFEQTLDEEVVLLLAKSKHKG